MKDSSGEAERWLRQAENDIGFARLALNERYYHQACFISQQAAEKALKAILYARGERIVLGHSLVGLVAEVAKAIPEVAERREGAGILDQYYIPTRYPNGLPGGVPFEAFGEAQARAALDEAARFVALATAHTSPNRERDGTSDPMSDA
ncbi:MAG: HEPN domain-containing protein [Gemmatimonas sp.]|nr:HEPN domain-containing protein [Gemmatimonas sp.]